MAYDVVSNATFWFCHHHLFDAARRPRTGRRWSEAWEAYRLYNRLFAERVAAVAPEGGRVLVQDYHLTLVGAELARERPDLRTVHFTHTPFADPSVLRMLPTPPSTSCWPAWPVRRLRVPHRALGRRLPGLPSRRSAPVAPCLPRSSPPWRPTPTGSSPRSASPAWPRPCARLESEIGGPDRRIILRVDRMELSKNLLRGLLGLRGAPGATSRRGGERVVMVALAYPSRQGLAEYLAYQNEVESTVARINERWAVAGLDADRPPRRGRLPALARRPDPLRRPARQPHPRRHEPGGKGGTLGQRRRRRAGPLPGSGRLRGTGRPLLEVNPFDVGGTAAVLSRALAMPAGERAAAAKSLRDLVTARSPADWLDEQLEQADRIS